MVRKYVKGILSRRNRVKPFLIYKDLRYEVYSQLIDEKIIGVAYDSKTDLPAFLKAQVEGKPGEESVEVRVPFSELEFMVRDKLTEEVIKPPIVKEGISKGTVIPNPIQRKK